MQKLSIKVPHNKGIPLDQTPEQFLARRSIRSPNGCILWTRSVGSNGSGVIGDRFWGKYYNVHTPYQLAYILNNGNYDRKLLICHTCHDRRCINPAHLYAGTHKQNTADMFRAGRQVLKRGSEINSSKLIEKDVWEIKQLLNNKIYTQQRISEIYGVHRITINDIYNGRTWAHI